MTKPPRLCLVTEFMKEERAAVFAQRAPLKLNQLLKLSSGVALGMDYLHKVNVIHRDLKTANLLMDENEVVVATLGGEGQGDGWEGDDCGDGDVSLDGAGGDLAPEVRSSATFSPSGS